MRRLLKRLRRVSRLAVRLAATTIVSSRIAARASDQSLAMVGFKIAGKSNIVGDDAWSQPRGGR